MKNVISNLSKKTQYKSAGKKEYDNAIKTKLGLRPYPTVRNIIIRT